MNLLKGILFLLIVILTLGCKNDKSSTETENISDEIVSDTKPAKVEVKPISHGTLVLETDDQTIYVDPTGGLTAFKEQKAPTLVLITDIHGDHLDIDTLKELNLKSAQIVAPQAVVDKFPEDFKPTYKVLNNGESAIINSISIEAIPMYNLREEALKYHTKGRGNGYVLTTNDERIYISGDTEDIPEMRSLKNIDKALVCMNLPYTMTVDSAASAVLDFKPKHVYPYHYRGTEGLSDIEKFKNLVNSGDSSIDVVLLDWY